MSLKKNLSLIYLIYLSRASVSLLLIPLLIRRLDESWGIFATVYSFIQLSITAMEFGFGVSATKNVAKHRDDQTYLNQIVSSVIVVQGFIFLAVAVFGIPGIYLNLLKDPLIYLLVILSILAQGLSPLWFLRGMEDLYAVSAAEVASKFLMLIAVYLFVTTDADINKVYAIHLLGALLPTVFGFVYMYRRYLKRGGGIFSRHALRSHLSDGLVFFGVRLSGMFVSVGGSFMLGASGNLLLAGQFAIGERILNAVRNLLFPAWDVVFPKLVSMLSSGHGSAANFRRMSTLIMIIFSTVTSISLYLCSPQLVQYFAGNQDEGTITIIRLLSFVPLLVGVINSVGLSYLVAQDSDRQFLWSIVAGSLAYLVAVILICYVFVESISNLGIYLSISHVLALFISLVMVLFFYSRGKRNEP